VATPFGAVLIVSLPIMLMVGLSGPAPSPSLAPPTRALGSATLSAAMTPSSIATDASTQAAKCNVFERLLGTCPGSGGGGALLWELAIAALLHHDWPTTTTSSSTTTSTSSTTTTSTSSTTTTTTSTLPPDCAGSAPPIAPPSGSWSCTFDDEFNGTSLDTSKWQPQLTANSGYTTGPIGNEVCYVDSPDTIYENDGYLSLTVLRTNNQPCKEPDGLSIGTHWQGGMVSSYQLFSQQYGYFQVRAELPAVSVRGLQETLWLYPENQSLYGPWPDSGEIDYGEFYSSQSTVDFPVDHFPGSQNDPNASTTAGCGITGATPAGQFNTYALSWTPTTITAYFNGVPCITDAYGSYVTSPDKAPEPFNQPFFLAFTQALGMGTDAPGPDTPARATTELDWVRVWQYG
jgi:beta-glucanase (GH16 family)